MKSERFGYPRPMLVRDGWTCLNGEWQFAIDREATLTSPGEVKWNKRITVPYAPETTASGIGDTSFYKRAWYRRTFKTPRLPRGSRLLLHFGAVDTDATVWVNGEMAIHHEGGYTPFFADVTDLLEHKAADQTLEVRADDDPHDLCKPRGKQEWQENPHAIWYPRTTGIWQTVWAEVVPATRIASLHWTPDVATSEMRCELRLAGDVSMNWRVRVELKFGEKVLADDTCLATRGELLRTLVLGDPAIEDFNIDFLWTPEQPNLIDATVELIDDAGKVCDRVTSYCAMRSVAIEGDRVTLNRRPVYLRFALDQGYWGETGLTPPDDAAAKRDVELAKAMGFNGVRKHQKIEDPRFLYWADKLGLMVWEECPSPYRFDPLAIERTTKTWVEAIRRDRSHPCIICWMPFNESWGVPPTATSCAGCCT